MTSIDTSRCQNTRPSVALHYSGVDSLLYCIAIESKPAEPRAVVGRILKYMIPLTSAGTKKG